MNTANVMRSSSVMAAGTAVSRVLGFGRAVVLLWALDVGPSADAFSVANAVPNALYILLAGGVLNAVLVPQITRAAKRADGGQEYIDRLLTAAIALLFVITVLITAVAPALMHVYASSDWTSSQFRLATAFALWCLPQVFWYGLYTMLGQVLNARGSFGPFMWAPVVNNVVAIGGLLLFIQVKGRGPHPIGTWTSGDIALLCGTATLGVAAQALVLIPAMRRAGIGFKIRWGLRGFGLRTAGRVAGWTFGQVVVQQLGFIVISQVTTAAGQKMERAHLAVDASGKAIVASGKVIYDNAFLLFMLPHSLIAVSLVTALFTRMSVSAADRRIDDVRSDLSLGLRLTGLATVLCAGGFIALAPDLTRVLFFKNGPTVTNGIAYATIGMMLGLVAFSAQYLFQRAFYAFEDARTPFLVQIPIAVIWSVGNLLSLFFLPADKIVIGVGVSMAIANVVGVTISAVLLNRRLDGIDGPHVLATHLKYLIAVVVGGVVAVVISRVLHAVAGDGRLVALLASMIGGAAVVAIYVVALVRMGTPELQDVLGPLIRRSGDHQPRHAAS